MSEERKRILKMLADGAISAAEAEQLLDSLGNCAGTQPTATIVTPVKKARYLYVTVTGNDSVDIRVPLGLVRAGMRLTSLIPPQAMEHINSSIHDKGISFDINNLKPNDVEELIGHLSDMAINVISKTGDTVKIYCGE